MSVLQFALVVSSYVQIYRLKVHLFIIFCPFSQRAMSDVKEIFLNFLDAPSTIIKQVLGLIEEETDRREGEGRCSCLGDVLECCILAI